MAHMSYGQGLYFLEGYIATCMGFYIVNRGPGLQPNRSNELVLENARVGTNHKSRLS